MDARSAFSCRLVFSTSYLTRSPLVSYSGSLRSIAVTDDGKSAHFFVYQIGFLEESVQVGALAFFIDTGGPVDGEANGDDTPAIVTVINNMVEVDQVRLW